MTIETLTLLSERLNCEATAEAIGAEIAALVKAFESFTKELSEILECDDTDTDRLLHEVQELHEHVKNAILGRALADALDLTDTVRAAIVGSSDPAETARRELAITHPPAPPAPPPDTGAGTVLLNIVKGLCADEETGEEAAE